MGLVAFGGWQLTSRPKETEVGLQMSLVLKDGDSAAALRREVGIGEKGRGGGGCSFHIRMQHLSLAEGGLLRNGRRPLTTPSAYLSAKGVQTVSTEH